MKFSHGRRGKGSPTIWLSDVLKNAGYASDLNHNDSPIVAKARDAVLVLRKADPDYAMLVSVWHVRENVRNAMHQRPLRFNTLEEAVQGIAGQFNIPLKRWIRKSELLRDALFQRRITEFCLEKSFNQR